MAARDRYKSDVKCPNCGEQGTLHISEDDHLYMKKLHRAIDKVEGKFEAVMINDADANITCSVCGHQFGW